MYDGLPRPSKSFIRPRRPWKALEGRRTIDISMIETFNLAAPPGFRGLHPDLPIRINHRHLPHWPQNGATYAVTFRLAQQTLPFQSRMKAHE